jgi:hypothetical protein
MRRAGAAVIGATVLLLALAALPAGAAATLTVTSGPATSITQTSATLTGTIDTGGIDTLWAFQYGPTGTYGSTTPVAAIQSGQGTVTVSAPITGLTPGTIYHFQLVAVEGSEPPVAQLGGDATLTTLTTANTVTDTAVTEPATSVTGITAQLNGVVYTGGSAATWEFQFGTSRSYNLHTTIQPIAAGQTSTFVVNAALTNLAAGTTYHYRLVALFGSPPNQNDSLGGDATFTTASGPAVSSSTHATASVVSRTIKVTGRTAGVAMRCTGPGGTQCIGRISLSARGKLGGKTKTVSCGAGGLVSSTGHQHTVSVILASGCRTLLKAGKGRLAATLNATFSTHQGGIRLGVTLRG